MRYTVDNQCVGCGLCARLCPDVFYMGADGFAHAADKEVPRASLDAADAAYDDCPMAAIHMNLERVKVLPDADLSQMTRISADQ